jgi:hypothetical protein
MRSHILKALGIASAAMALATSAQAQGRGRDHDKDRDKVRDKQHDARDDRRRPTVVGRADGDVVLVPRNRVGVPPGLAKKPGQMPPGQFKKRYTTLQGANALGSVLTRRGYVVQRIVPSGTSRIVYYRGPDGVVHRAIVSPGTNQLGFSNVPSSLLQEVLSSLY